MSRTWTRLGIVAIFPLGALVAACSSNGGGSDSTNPTSSSGGSSGQPGTPDGGPGQDPHDGDPNTPWNPPVETGAVAFPYTAYKCGYAIRQVSPSKPAAIFHEDVSGASPTPKNLHLTIAGNASSSVVVQWSTDDATHATEVRFGDTPTSLDKTAHGFSFTYGISGRREHEVHLCGLAPNRTYYYDAGGSKGRSTPYKFTTAPDAATDVTILVAGDSRTDPTVFGGFAAKALAMGPTAMLLTGDAVESGTDPSLWDAFFAQAPDLFAQLPGLWAHGNHENLAEPYFAQLALPDHGGADDIEQWYATTYGPVRFVVLNDTVASGSTINGAERTFLDATLSAVDRTRTPFVAASHHQPMYTTSSSHAPDTTIRGAWAPLFDQYHVNVDLAGHVHSYESTKPLKGGTATSDGTIATTADGTTYINFGGAGAPLYSFVKTKPAYLVGQESTHGFAIMTVNATTMTWKAYRQDGSTIETITLP